MDATKENEIKPDTADCQVQETAVQRRKRETLLRDRTKAAGSVWGKLSVSGVPEAGDYLRQCWLISAPKNRMQMQAYSHSIRITTAVKLPYI